MAAGEESRKVHCDCSKLLATFTEQGLELFCRFSKETTTVPYGLTSLRDAIAYVEKRRRRQARERRRGPRI